VIDLLLHADKIGRVKVVFVVVVKGRREMRRRVV
jgi:hypothetical protein